VVLGGAGPGDPGNYLPLEVGNRWVFSANYGGAAASDTTVRVEGRRVVEGVTGVVVRESTAGGYGPVDEEVLVSDASGIAYVSSGDPGSIDALIAPYWFLRYPLEPGNRFVQVNRKNVSYGEDVDGDGRDDAADLWSEVTVAASESVTVPVGTFAGCARVEWQMTIDLHLSTGDRVRGSALETAWFAPGVGWVKRTHTYSIEGQPYASETLLEELVEYEIAGQVVTAPGRTTVPGNTSPALARIEISPATAVLLPDATTSLYAMGFDSRGYPIYSSPFTWASSNPAIATVDASGTVRGVSPGTVAITASAGGKTSTPVSVTVSGLRVLALPANDLIYDATRERIYASVPSREGVHGNSIAVIDPATGTVLSHVFAGSEPSKLALSDDARFLYAALDGAAAVTRIDLAAPSGPAVDLTFSLGPGDWYGPRYAEDLAVMPGSPRTVAVSLRYKATTPRHAGVAVYDDGVQRPNATPGHTGSNVIEFSSSASLLYGLNNETTEFGLRRMAIDASGVSVSSVDAFESMFGADIAFGGGQIFSTSGAVYDPEGRGLLGTFGGMGSGSIVEATPIAPRVLALTPSQSSSTWVLRAYDRATYVPLASEALPTSVRAPRSLVRWGARGVAFRDGGDYSQPGGAVYFLETPVVAP
jgi:hypothetical protein